MTPKTKTIRYMSDIRIEGEIEGEDARRKMREFKWKSVSWGIGEKPR